MIFRNHPPARMIKEFLSVIVRRNATKKHLTCPQKIPPPNSS
jgi:hypothetical protein